jgi:hypothetical protein
MAIFDQENKIKFPAVNFFSSLGHQTLDPDPGSGSAIRKNAGPGSRSGSALNQCGPETLFYCKRIWGLLFPQLMGGSCLIMNLGRG